MQAARRPVFSKIFSEIDHTLIDVQQSIAWSALCVDHIVGFELDMEKLQLVQRAGVIDSYRRVVN